MPFLKFFLAVVLLSITTAGNAQTATWSTLHYGKLSLKYPPTWHMEKETRGNMTRVTLTPDSMRGITMKLIEIYDLPVSPNHTYEGFRTQYPAMLKAQFGGDVKMEKTEEISLKGRKAVYAEFIQSSLPSKFYGLNAETSIYAMMFIPRRWINTPDPGLERDETAILNSITIN